MIDAYEIGIQLMLQDDVSAGLAVINRGLAEVDRAIAATSANFAALSRETGTATKTAAAASSNRTSPIAVNSQQADPAANQSNPGPSKRDSLRTVAPSSEESPTVPEMKAAEPVAPTKPTSSQPDIGSIEAEPDMRDRAIASSAPIRSAVDETLRDGQRATKQQTEPELTPAKAPAQGAPTASILSEIMTLPIRETASAGREARRSAPPRATPVAMTASVPRDQRSETNGARPDRAEYQTTSGPASQRERAVAPWSGITDQGMQAEQMRLHDRAAAPKSAAQDQNQSAGGTVMLDGRLVGQWLSEHMAREASRPPAGTSFFDPRQTPAWNVSGAL